MSDIIVYGRAKTGQTLFKMAERLGFNAIYYDDEKGFGDDRRFCSSDKVVLSPGVKPNAKGRMLAADAGAQIVSELDFCYPHLVGRCVSVTGTNGKTTTCQLIYHILQYAGFPSRLLGNGGVPLSNEVLNVAANETVVLESSSFQLAETTLFAPYISVVTNVAPDHLDYHGDFSSYLCAKRNNFSRQRANDFALFNADDDVALELSSQSVGYTLYYSTENSNANCYYSGNELHLNLYGEPLIFSCPFLGTLARHNLSNALCAILACYLLGVDVGTSCESLPSYKFLPHRLQTVKHYLGVTFVDDSKATNVHATVSALNCFDNVPLALILGGSDKGFNFDDIFVHLKNNVKFVCAVGQTAQKIQSDGKKYFVEVTVFADYKQAVENCFKAVKDSGGVVLMSNACASFDMFDGYAQRGEYFTQLVEELCRENKEI